MKKFKIIFTYCLLILTAACNSHVEDNVLPSRNTSQDIPPIAYKNGVVVLNNSKTLNDILQNKLEITNQTITLQQDILDNLMKEERKHAISLKDISNEEYTSTQKHSNLYNSLLEKEFIKVQKYTDGSELYSLNLIQPNYGKVVNQDGFFAIQDTIYQITSDKFKIWINGDIDDLSTLSLANETELQKGIYVYSKTDNNVSTKSFPSNIPNYQAAYYRLRGDARVVLSYYDNTTLDFSSLKFKRDIYVRYSYQQKIGSNFVFAAAPFGLRAWFFLDDSPTSVVMSTNSTASDMWYTVVFMNNYNFLSQGQNQQEVTDESYRRVYSFGVDSETFISDKNKHIYIGFGGHEMSTYPGMVEYESIDENSHMLLPMLPE